MTSTQIFQKASLCYYSLTQVHMYVPKFATQLKANETSHAELTELKRKSTPTIPAQTKPI